MSKKRQWSNKVNPQAYSEDVVDDRYREKIKEKMKNRDDVEELANEFSFKINNKDLVTKNKHII